MNHHDCLLGRTDLIDFTASRSDEHQAIIVMPDVGSGPVWQGKHGRALAERWFIDRLMTWVDEEFRTIADADARAVAGLSAGGLGALMLAARNPDRFAVVAGLSAVAEMDERDPAGVGIGMGASALLVRRDGVADPFVQFGDPLLAPIEWRAANPVESAVNFGGLTVHLFTGDGSPCALEDFGSTPVVDFWPTGFGLGEGQIKRWNESLSRALVGAGVPHVLATGCGLHTYGAAQRAIHAWWAPMFAAFGSRRAAPFDHRRVDPYFSVWGWTFAADEARAPEFLDVADASCEGLGLTGSGLTTVTTARCFTAGSEVRVDGASHVADAAGRITFAVDLGPAHEFEQFTPAARALEAAGGYWTSKTVMFERGES